MDAQGLLNALARPIFDPTLRDKPAPDSDVIIVTESGVFFDPYWAAYLDGVIARLDSPELWATDADAEAATLAIQRLLEILQNGIPTGGAMTQFALRQSEVNPDLLEQSIDGGETWTLAFNYGLLRINSTLNNMNRILKESTILEAENNAEVDPSATGDTYGSRWNDATEMQAEIDYKALCLAADVYARGLHEALAQAVSFTDNFDELIGGLIGSVAVGVAALLGLTLGATAAAIATTAGIIAVDNAIDLTAANLRDSENIDFTRCLILGKLANAPTTKEAFLSIFNDFQPCATTVQNGIRVAFQIQHSLPLLSDTLWGNFVTVLTATRQAVNPDNYQDITCAPCEEGWAYRFTFDGDARGWAIVQGSLTSGGIVSESTAVQQLSRIERTITIPESAGTVKMSVRAVPTGNANRFGSILVNGVTEVTDPLSFGDFVFQYTFPAGGTFAIAVTTITGNLATSTEIEWVQFESATGVNPFDVCSNAEPVV